MKNVVFLSLVLALSVNVFAYEIIDSDESNQKTSSKFETIVSLINLSDVAVLKESDPETYSVITRLHNNVKQNPEDANSWFLLAKLFYIHEYYEQALYAANEAAKTYDDNEELDEIVLKSSLRMVSDKRFEEVLNYDSVNDGISSVANQATGSVSKRRVTRKTKRYVRNSKAYKVKKRKKLNRYSKQALAKKRQKKVAARKAYLAYLKKQKLKKQKARKALARKAYKKKRATKRTYQSKVNKQKKVYPKKLVVKQVKRKKVVAKKKVTKRAQASKGKNPFSIFVK